MQKIFRRSRFPPSRPGIRKLRDDLEIKGKCNAKLDALLVRSEEKEENSRKLDEVEGRMTEAILEVLQETIPSNSKREMDKPWTNTTYQGLTQRPLSERDPIKRKALYYETRKMQTELKNNYFKTKADQLNFESEQRDTEQEFHMTREHTSTLRFNKPLSLEEHFSSHFSDRKYDPQPELGQPEGYPHVLPRDDALAIDDSVPERREVESSIKKLKNGKCQGTDKIYAERLKYSRSSGLLDYMGLLIGLIWSCAQVPGKWFTASITVEYCIPNEVSPREYHSEAPAHGTIWITELLYADDEAIFANSIKELKTILEIYDRTFVRFGLKMSYSKNETMAFNIDEEIKSQESLITIGDNEIKNVRTFKYLRYTSTNDEKKTFRFLYARIGAAYQKWNELNFS